MQINLRTFLAPGQTFPNDDATDAGPLFQTAVNAIESLFTVPVQLIVATGRYRMTTQVTWKTRAGIVGAGQGRTVLLPYGEVTALKRQSEDGDADGYLEDCRFIDFTIDGINQTSTPSNSLVKGIFLAFVRRIRLTRLEVKNSWMTGFGIDYADGAVIESCIARNAGRGTTNTLTAGAGFGFALGKSARNQYLVRNCESYDNQTFGFFTEDKFGVNPNAELYSLGFIMEGCTARGNYSGFADTGCREALVSGCNFSDNRAYGIYLGKTGANTSSGVEGRISDTICSRNGLDGVHLAEVAGVNDGGYTLEGIQAADNVRHGVHRVTPGGAVIDVLHSITPRRSRIFRNGGSGVRVASNSVVTRLVISDSDIYNNGTDAGQTYRNGITLLGPTEFLTIAGNRIYDSRTTGKTQRYGIAAYDAKA
ncbi:MAG: right-handed parallel beta-helix repeat-containing protein [Nocardioides sp.]|uniref:right-handed parallel beta-helix repeat-containing protein n=1 Tax=Nocardioides sp. TaxID=35761 RepID=UPI0023932701|nr:right-handed parallel beta-helix repeat-containing protein [Nocardioides sp.]MDE0776835.1 right-handed parallel beta-helix repeat-containing protein [Nocardioides sp.]